MSDFKNGKPITNMVDLIEFYNLKPGPKELNVGEEMAIECLSMAEILLNLKEPDVDAALEWIERAKLNINPPYPPSKSGASGAIRGH